MSAEHYRPLRLDSDTVNAGTMNQRLSSWWIAACGVWLIGLGLYFIAVRPPLLVEEMRFIGATAAQIQAALPGLEGWLKRVFAVMGGFMAGAGVLTVFVATVAMPSRFRGTSWAIAVAGTLTVALMSAINFSLRSDFGWLLLVSAMVWLAGVVLHLTKCPGRTDGRQDMREARSSNE
jgi:hypothetical protein